MKQALKVPVGVAIIFATGYAALWGSCYLIVWIAQLIGTMPR